MKPSPPPSALWSCSEPSPARTRLNGSFSGCGSAAIASVHHRRRSSSSQSAAPLPPPPRLPIAAAATASAVLPDDGDVIVSSLGATEHCRSSASSRRARDVEDDVVERRPENGNDDEPNESFAVVRPQAPLSATTATGKVPPPISIDDAEVLDFAAGDSSSCSQARDSPARRRASNTAAASRPNGDMSSGQMSPSLPRASDEVRTWRATALSRWQHLWMNDSLDNPAFMAENLEHFRSLVFFFLRLEQFLSLGALGCFVDVLRVVSLPLWCVLNPTRITLRHLVVLMTLFACVFSLCGWSFVGITHPYSELYHAIRRQSALKIYVIYSICEVAGKLLAAFGADVQEALWSALGCYQHDTRECFSQVLRDVASEESVAATPSPAGEPPAGTAKRSATGGDAGTSAGPVSSHHPPSKPMTTAHTATVGVRGKLLLVMCTLIHCMVHSWVLLVQIVVLNVALNSHSPYALAALLISNNFVEIKSFVQKRHSPEGLFQIGLADIVERVYQAVFVLVILLRQQVTEGGFAAVEVTEIAGIFLLELFIDFTKHVFIARFNALPLSLYVDFQYLLQWDTVRQQVSAARKVVRSRRRASWWSSWWSRAPMAAAMPQPTSHSPTRSPPPAATQPQTETPSRPSTAGDGTSDRRVSSSRRRRQSDTNRTSCRSDVTDVAVVHLDPNTLHHRTAFAQVVAAKLSCSLADAAFICEKWRRIVGAPVPGTLQPRRCRRAGLLPQPCAGVLLWSVLPSRPSLLLWQSTDSVMATVVLVVLVGIGVMALAKVLDTLLMALSLRTVTRELLDRHSNVVCPTAQRSHASTSQQQEGIVTGGSSITASLLSVPEIPPLAAVLDGVSQFRHAGKSTSR